LAGAATEDWSREIRLTGASNFRDIGGYRTADGRTVRRGLVFRSANLGTLAGDDHAILSAIRLRTICDFRGDEECAGAPTPLEHIAAPALHRLTIHPRLGASLRDLVQTGQATGVAAGDLMRQVYRAYAVEFAEVYRRLFQLMLDERNLPLLFHCSAGKDRTGFGAALLLKALGVPDETILEDYLLTNRLWRGSGHLADLPDHIRAVVAAVHPDYLAAAFGAIETELGGMPAFMEEKLGLDAAAVTRLRDVLLD
jgi:protein-tyrosine phosphatase